MNNPLALITGASKGIGESVALRLAEDGFDLWLNYRSDHQRAESIRERVLSMGRDCVLLPFDVADSHACATALTFLLEERTPFTVINNAKISIECRLPVEIYGQWGGFTPSVHEIKNKCRELLGKK